MSDEGDPFESLLFLEESCHKDGYAKGWKAGQRKGISVGRSLGIDKGKEIGSEIGYYAGFVSTWLLLIDKSDKKTSRIKTLLQNLDTSINQLSIVDPSDQNLFANIDKIRAKFKQELNFDEGGKPENSKKAHKAQEKE